MADDVTTERQEPGTEQLFALDRLAEQLDPVLCEFAAGPTRCGSTATWFGKPSCSRAGGSFICDQHHVDIEAALLKFGAQCLTHRVPLLMAWTKL